MPNRIGGHGIDGGLLDSGISNFSGARNRGRSGECQICQERCWTQDRLAGLPVVANPAHVWVVSRLVSAGGGDGGVTLSAGINRHVVRDERALQERRTANPSWPRVLRATS